MRISILLVIGLCISIAIAEKEPSKDKSIKASAPASKHSRSSKSLTDNRGKRTLSNLGYPGFSYSVDANRRQGAADGRAFYAQDGLYNGQSAIGQYSFPETSNHLADYSQFSQYPQYLEAPEPIIEIIIKDSNETLPTQSPQPLIQKKKKEKVHVYYVKYKKDENNKLHLEEPIASLNNHETDVTEEEEEEIVHYPTIVTPIPPLKTTTLRTIIHPDSEKFHSNSGIHVTFGSEDRSQSGHELQEDNAESVLSSVVALPQTANFPPKPAPTANVRADFGDARTALADRYQGYQSGSYYQNQNVQPEYKPSIQQQQLPVAQSLPPFRPQPQQQSHQSFQQQQHQQHQQYQQQQQRQYYSQVQQSQSQSQSQNQAGKQYPRPTASTPSSSSQYQSYQQQNIFAQQPQYQQYQYSQQQQQPRPQQQQQQRPVAQPLKQTVFFPTPPPKSQDLQSHQSSGSYQPVKFRPTPVPSGQKVERPPLAQIQPYNRPPSFAQKPAFSTQPQGSIFDNGNRYQKPQKSPSPKPEQNYNQQPQIPYNHKPQSPTSSFSQNSNSNSNLGQLHNFFDIRPSKETELLKAIPKFEQHITEVGGNRYNNYSPYSSGNQVIHDIPAPNLGPTNPTTPSSQQRQTSSAGQYNVNSGSYRQQFNNFVTSPSPLQYQSTTQAPQYIQSNDGQQIQIVTPMPSTNYYSSQRQSQSQSQSQFVSSGSQPQVIPNSQPRPQQLYSQQQQPRQSESSQFSVSTLHSDVFRELEHRKNSLTKQENGNEAKNNHTNFPGSSAKAATPSTTPAASSAISKNAAQASLQLPDEVPDDLRQQLLSSGILDNADISILDYDKVGDVALENLPAEHLQHFYGAGGGAQISESNKVLTVVRPNGDSVNFSEKSIDKAKETKSLPQKQNVDLKVIRFNANNERSVSDKFIKTDSTVVPPVDLADRQYSRYLPLKINGAQFPIPDVEELQGKKVASVVVLAPVDNLQGLDKDATDDGRSERDTTDSKEVKFVSGDIIKQLIKKPTRENFRKWLEKESRTDVDSQSVVLLVAKSSEEGQEIFMYDIATGAVNKLNGELSSAFVNVAEENASAENLDHASTLDPSILEHMMEKKTTV